MLIKIQKYLLILIVSSPGFHKNITRKQVGRRLICNFHLEIAAVLCYNPLCKDCQEVA